VKPRLITSEGATVLGKVPLDIQNGFIVLRPERTPETVHRMAAALKAGIPFRFENQTPLPENGNLPAELAAIFYTSGTTSNPKAVPLLRSNIEAAVQSSAQNIIPEEGAAWLLCLPLHHVGGANVIFRAVLSGMDIRFQPQFDVHETAAIRWCPHSSSVCSNFPIFILINTSVQYYWAAVRQVLNCCRKHGDGKFRCCFRTA
jgi:acyl-CoA synthetase (AMP-forming)/AMP-acid ligase II